MNSAVASPSPTRTVASRLALATAAAAGVSMLVGCGMSQLRTSRAPRTAKTETALVSSESGRASYAAESNRSSQPSTRPAQTADTGTTAVSTGQRHDEVIADASGIDFSRDFKRDEMPNRINSFGEFDGQPNQHQQVHGATGLAQLTYVDEGYDADVCVDSTGQQMIFASTRHSDRTDIYRQKVGSQSVTQLTADPADDAFPTFSNDGRTIAFASNRTGSWDIFTMDANGKNVTQITSDATQDLHPTFSPDGTRIAFSRYGGKSGRWEVWVADLQTGERKMVGFGLFPDWSPREDRDMIAYQRARQRGTRWFSLWCLELRDGEPLAPTEVAVSTNAAIVAPSWSPDGSEITFATVIEPSEKYEHGQQDIWIVNADGSDRRRLTDGIGTNATPTWGGDGRVYFISDRGGQECVWSAAATVESNDGFARQKDSTDNATVSLPIE